MNAIKLIDQKKLEISVDTASLCDQEDGLDVLCRKSEISYSYKILRFIQNRHIQLREGLYWSSKRGSTVGRWGVKFLGFLKGKAGDPCPKPYIDQDNLSRKKDVETMICSKKGFFLKDRMWRTPQCLEYEIFKSA